MTINKIDKSFLDPLATTDITDYQTEIADKISILTDKSNSRFINVLYPPVPLIGAKGDGTSDDTTALQNIINSLSGFGGIIFFPRPAVHYRITNALNILNNSIDPSGTLCLIGEAGLNTQILLDNNSATELLKYDNGTKRIDLANCSTTNASNIVTTTGNFNTSGIEVGMYINLSNLKFTAKVSSIDSATQITVDKTATGTGTGTARFYKLVTSTHRLVIKDLLLKHSMSVTAFTSWHISTALRLWGTHDSQFENIRTSGFTVGVHSLGGYLNKFENINVNGCKDGIVLEFSTYGTTLEKPIAPSCGSNSGGYGISLVNTGGVTINNIVLETSKRGLLLEGARGVTINGGNIETIDYDYSITTKGLSNIASSDQDFWTKGVNIFGLRFYSAIGLLVLNGTKGVRFFNNSFESNTGMSVSASTCINASGDLAYMKDIEYGNNHYYTGAEPNRHILTGTLATAQSFLQNGRRFASSIPYYGKYWKVGDIVHHSNPTAGGFLGWICTTASDGMNDGSAVWKTFGTIQA